MYRFKIICVFTELMNHRVTRSYGSLMKLYRRLEAADRGCKDTILGTKSIFLPLQPFKREIFFGKQQNNNVNCDFFFFFMNKIWSVSDLNSVQLYITGIYINIHLSHHFQNSSFTFLLYTPGTLVSPLHIFFFCCFYKLKIIFCATDAVDKAGNYPEKNPLMLMV